MTRFATYKLKRLHRRRAVDRTMAEAPELADARRELREATAAVTAVAGKIEHSRDALVVVAEVSRLSIEMAKHRPGMLREIGRGVADKVHYELGRMAAQLTKPAKPPNRSPHP